jgi:hypothetical protein
VLDAAKALKLKVLQNAVEAELSKPPALVNKRKADERFEID